MNVDKERKKFERKKIKKKFYKKIKLILLVNMLCFYGQSCARDKGCATDEDSSRKRKFTILYQMSSQLLEDLTTLEEEEGNKGRRTEESPDTADLSTLCALSDDKIGTIPLEDLATQEKIIELEPSPTIKCLELAAASCFSAGRFSEAAIYREKQLEAIQNTKHKPTTADYSYTALTYFNIGINTIDPKGKIDHFTKPAGYFENALEGEISPKGILTLWGKLAKIYDYLEDFEKKDFYRNLIQHPGEG